MTKIILQGGQAGIGKGTAQDAGEIFLFDYPKGSYRDRLEITAQFLLHGIKQIIVLARSEDKFRTACEDWSHRDGITRGELHARVQFVRCDLCDITDVQTAAKEISKKTDHVHILLCNAGKFVVSPIILAFCD